MDGALTTHSTDTTVPNIPPVVALAYGYDKMGNRTHMHDARPGVGRENRDWEYAYDGLNRLTEAHRGVSRSGAPWEGPLDHAEPRARQQTVDGVAVEA